MEFGQLLDMLKAAVPVVGILLQVMGSCVIVASAIVKATQSQSDDEAFARLKAVPILGSLIVALERFSLFDRKPE